MRQALDLQADRIEQVLRTHRLDVAVVGGTVTPRLVQFRLAAAPDVRVGSIRRLDEELALSLGARSCRVVRQAGSLSVEIPREMAVDVPLLPLCRRLGKVPGCTAVLGVGQEGSPLLLRLSSPDVSHVLISGTTGSGKTELARSMIASLAMLNRRSEAQVALVDPKGSGFAPFSALPHLFRDICRSDAEAAGLLAGLVAEMEYRGAEGRCEPRLVLFIDELADLLMTGGTAVVAALTRLTQRGRGAGIHVVACTQKPAATAISTLIRSNFPARVVGAVPSPEDAKMASGIARSGAEKLLGRGDFILVARGEVRRFQAARVSDSEIGELCAVPAPLTFGMPGSLTTPGAQARAAAG